MGKELPKDAEFIFESDLYRFRDETWEKYSIKQCWKRKSNGEAWLVLIDSLTGKRVVMAKS